MLIESEKKVNLKLKNRTSFSIVVINDYELSNILVSSSSMEGHVFIP